MTIIIYWKRGTKSILTPIAGIVVTPLTIHLRTRKRTTIQYNLSDIETFEVTV